MSEKKSPQFDKKPLWNISEIADDEEISKGYPGVEVKWLITGDTVEGNQNTLLHRIVFEPGASFMRHRHKNAEEVVYIISGKIKCGLNDQGRDIEYECRSGTAIFYKKNQVHWSANPFSEPCEYISCYIGAPSKEKSGFVSEEDK